MVIPFQAIEVYLDNVVPVESKSMKKLRSRDSSSCLDQEEFTPEAIEGVKEMILGSPFKAMVTGYHYDNTPFIQLSRRADFVSRTDGKSSSFDRLIFFSND